MSLLRTAAARATTLRVAPTLARTYTPDVRQAGATASSKGFSQREQAKEGQYIRRREEELLKAAKKRLEEAKADVADHQAKIDAHDKK